MNAFDKLANLSEELLKLLVEERENNKALWNGIKKRDKQIKSLKLLLNLADEDYEDLLDENDALKNEIGQE